MIEDRIAFPVEVSGRRELQGLQAGGGHGHGAVEFAKFDGDVRDHDIDQIEAAVLPLSAGVAGAIGDAAHFLEDLAIEAAQKEGAGLGAEPAPSSRSEEHTSELQ